MNTNISGYRIIVNDAGSEHFSEHGTVLCGDDAERPTWKVKLDSGEVASFSGMQFCFELRA
jgi:hypothetical protein